MTPVGITVNPIVTEPRLINIIQQSPHCNFNEDSPPPPPKNRKKILLLDQKYLFCIILSLVSRQPIHFKVYKFYMFYHSFKSFCFKIFIRVCLFTLVNKCIFYMTIYMINIIKSFTIRHDIIYSTFFIIITRDLIQHFVFTFMKLEFDLYVYIS